MQQQIPLAMEKKILKLYPLVTIARGEGRPMSDDIISLKSFIIS